MAHRLSKTFTIGLGRVDYPETRDIVSMQFFPLPDAWSVCDLYSGTGRVRIFLCVVDHEKQEFYVQFSFVIIEGNTPVDRGARTKTPKARTCRHTPGAERGGSVCCLSVPPLSARLDMCHEF